MLLPDTIIDARKKKGLTQEELADKAQVTVRTIQRIERGESTPRAFTLKAIATALDIPFETLQAGDSAPAPEGNPAARRQFLQLLCLSCFSYLVLPYIHFLVPAWLLKRNPGSDPQIRDFGRRLIREQLCWVIALHLLLLLTLAYNFLQAAYLGNRYFLHYLWPFFFMYIANAVIITAKLLPRKMTDPQ